MSKIEAHFHITVKDVTNTEQFIKDCKKLGGKATILELSDGKGNVLMYDYIFTTKRMYFKNGDEIQKAFKKYIEKVEKLGYNVVRRKIEINPYTYLNGEDEKTVEYPQYFETHFKVVVDNRNDDKNKLINIANKLNCFVSDNILDKFNDYQHVEIITIRRCNTNFKDFLKQNNKLVEELAKNNIFILESGIEYAIFDDNPEWDKEWINSYYKKDTQ